MIEMQVVNTRPGKPRDGGTRLEAFEADVELSYEGEISDYVLIPSDIRSVTVTLYVTGGVSGYVEATTDRIEKVIDGTAEYIMWPQGIVDETTQDSCYPPTAIRAVWYNAGLKLPPVPAGGVSMSVRAQ